MSNTSFYRFAGWCAYLSAAMVVLGLIAFMLFWSTFSQTGTDNIWGPINDATSVILALANIVVLIALHRLYRRVAPTVSLMAVVAGIAAMLVAAVMQSLLILKVIVYADIAMSVPLAFAAYGGVLIVYGVLARRAGDWSNRLVWFGILAGVGYVLTIAGFPTGSVDSPVTYAGGLLTVIFATAWAIGFGRLLRGYSVKRMIVPCPTTLSAVIVPPCASTRSLAIANPNPEPRESLDLV